MNRPYRYAATTKLKRNAADGLFTKPSIFHGHFVVYLLFLNKALRPLSGNRQRPLFILHWKQAQLFLGPGKCGSSGKKEGKRIF